jgi:hypothetical protein
MKKSHMFGTLLTLILAASVAVAVIIPSIALNAPSASGTLKAYGYSGEVLLQLPSPSIPSHPYNLRFLVQHYDERSAHGKEDVLGIYVWSTAYPGGSRFVWIGAIRDNQASIDFQKAMYGGVVGAENQMKVEDKELEIWTETASAQSGNGRWNWDEYGRYVWGADGGEVLKVNLTKAVTFNVGDPWPQHWKDLNFTLPPMTLEFRGFDEVFKDEVPPATLAPPYSGAGWTQQITAWRMPAWVEVTIPAWYRAINSYVVGQFNKKVEITWTPPAT